MKKTMTLCLLFASLVQGFGQFYDSFSNNGLTPCPFDSSNIVSSYLNWDMYQTLDGNWNGPIDSTVCISLKSNPNDGIDLLTLDLARPIFLRYKFTDANKIWLDPDWLYNVSAVTSSWGGANNVKFQGGTGCPGNICSGVFVGIEIPDASGNSTTLRWHTDVPDYDSNFGSFQTCAPTEYFTNNYLREFIIKLFPEANTTPDQQLRMVYAGMENVWNVGYVDEVIAPPSTYVDTSYNVPIAVAADPNGGSWATNYLLHFTDTSLYPSSSTPSYVEGRPEVNTPDPQTINLIVEGWETLVPQPFAFLRGALVEGSDSIRHHVNLVNDGGDICMGTIIDFIFDDGTKYYHAGGHVNMEGLNACMMFRNGGCFEVAAGTTMQYGQDGRGILALRSGGQMVLGKGSTLLFDGTLWLQGIPTAQHPDPQFYLDLKPGSSLVFGEKAGVLNANSISPDIRLNVYMNGGILDDHLLSPAERLLIHRIYPTPSKRFSENVQVLGSPVAGQFRLDYLSAGQERVLVQVHDLQGRLAWSKSYETVQGHNPLDGEFGAGAAGVYVATLSGKGGQAAVKLVKMD